MLRRETADGGVEARRLATVQDASQDVPRGLIQRCLKLQLLVHDSSIVWRLERALKDSNFWSDNLAHVLEHQF
jgi:hypothetical protein